MSPEERVLGFSFIVTLVAISSVFVLFLSCCLDEMRKKKKAKVKIEWKWADKWFGVYDDVRATTYFFNDTRTEHHYWICIVPCFPIHIWWEVK